MRIVYMGTPEFAVPALQALAACTMMDVVAVVTQPDRPKGRGKGIQFSPVKEAALALGLPVLQPESLRKNRNPQIFETLQNLQADVFVVAAYGQLLPPRILRLPPLGCINIHASLLPKYRGAAPIHRAILNGETETGITIMQMDKGLDTGDMLLKKALPIGANDRYPAVHDALAQLSCECILETPAKIHAIQPTPQDPAQATYAAMLSKEEGRVDWARSAMDIYNQIRAFDPWPGTFTFYGSQDAQLLKIWDADPITGGTYSPLGNTLGQVVANQDGLHVMTGEGVLRVTELQGQNGKRMSAGDYLRGKPIEVGTVLG